MHFILNKKRHNLYIINEIVTRNYKCTENGKLECAENGNNSAQLFYFQM